MTDRSQHLALVRLQLQRRANLTHRSPPLSTRVGDQLLDELRLAHSGDTRLVLMKTKVLEIASSQDNVDRRSRRDLFDALDLVVRASIRRERNQSPQSVVFGGLQLFHHQIDIDAEVLVNERRAIHECVGRKVFQDRANDRPLWHGDGVHAFEYVLSRRQGFSVPG